MTDYLPYILLIICTIIIGKDLLLSGFLFFNLKKGSNEFGNSDQYPFVSVLVAARNEESTIKACIKSLTDQNYPQDKFEILIGNDGSVDRTYEILKNLETTINNLTVLDIEILIQEKPGKMNTLAQLGELARGDYLLFTDADTRVPPDWIENMTRELTTGKGIVTGTTIIEAKDTFQRLQRTEWVHAIGMMKLVSDMGIAVSSFGNNMGISRDAYTSVGGYRGIKFSITEDHEIFKQICLRGYSVSQLFEPSVLAKSNPSKNLWQLLLQRKRWMTGAFKLPFLMLAILILNSSYFPVLIVLMFYNFQLALLLFMAGVLVQIFFLKQLFRILKQKVSWADLLLYEIYTGIINVGAFIIFLLPVKIAWKDRKY